MNPQQNSKLALVKPGEQPPAGYKEVKRAMTARELERMGVGKYAACPCGSGRKFKFCHYQQVLQ